MELGEAEKLAYDFIREIADHCEKIRIVGSIRRRRPQVKDIDLVLIVKDWLSITTTLRKMSTKFLIDGTEQKRVIYKGQQFDLYSASPETWGTLILIRTGSAQHNVKLSTLARKKGMKLSHRGLEKKGKVIASTERKIFESLGLDYVEPEERD